MVSSINSEKPLCSFEKGAKQVKTIFNDSDIRQSIHRIVTSALQVVKEQAGVVPAPWLYIAKLIGVTDGVIDSAGLLTFPKYFVGKRLEKLPRLLEVKNPDGTVAIVKEAPHKIAVKGSQFKDDVVNKPLRAASKVAMLVATVAGFFAFLHETAILSSGHVVSLLNKIPVVGQMLAHFVNKVGLGAIAGGFYLVGASLKIFEASRYLILAKNDPTKDQKKGVYQLLARVGEVAFVAFGMAGVLSPLALGVMGIGVAAMSIKSALYNAARKDQKADIQKDLLNKFSTKTAAA